MIRYSEREKKKESTIAYLFGLVKASWYLQMDTICWYFSKLDGTRTKVRSFEKKRQQKGSDLIRNR